MPDSAAPPTAGAGASTTPLGAAVATSLDTGEDLTTEATPAATAPAAATAAAAGPTETPTVAAATPTVVAAAAAAPAAATEGVAAAGADGSASMDVVEPGLPPTGFAGVRTSDDGEDIRVETPFAAGRTSSDAGSITLVTSGVDTAGIGSATPIGVDRLAASSAGAEDAPTAGRVDGNATGAVTIALSVEALDAVVPTSITFWTDPVDFATADSDDATAEEAVGCVRGTRVVAAVAVASATAFTGAPTAAFAGGAGADFFEAPEATGAADGRTVVEGLTDVALAGVVAGTADGAVAGAAEEIDCDTTGDVVPDADGLGTDETFGPSGEAAAAGVDISDSLRVVDDVPVALGATGAATVDAAATGATAGAAPEATDALEVAEDAFISTPAVGFVDRGGMAPADSGAAADTAGAFEGAR